MARSEVISIDLTRQDAESLRLLCDNINYYDIGAALSRNKDFNERQINDILCTLGHICMCISASDHNPQE